MEKLIATLELKGNKDEWYFEWNYSGVIHNYIDIEISGPGGVSLETINVTNIQ